MPIYAYKCASCGHAKDVLQKLSDAPLTVCPACGAEAFGKQVTAAGFQLKGSGWYATDFRNGSKPAPEKSTDSTAAASPAASPAAAPADSAKTAADSKPADGAPKSGAPSASGGCGASCACR